MIGMVHEMTKKPNQVRRYPQLTRPTIAIVGGFGSGKTEVSVNLAKFLAANESNPVTLVDLDLVNPYFRSRETVKEMESLGIGVISPSGAHAFADLPILLPEVKGAIEADNRRLVLDVGGDAQGTKVFGSLADCFVPGKYDMLMVLNSRRPQTADLDGCIKTMDRIETTARLKFTGLISNSHMIDDTDLEVINEGYGLAQKVSKVSGLPLVFLSARRTILDTIDLDRFDCAVLPLTRLMLKPWEKREDS